jgi:hypothetical protein
MTAKSQRFFERFLNSPFMFDQVLNEAGVGRITAKQWISCSDGVCGSHHDTTMSIKLNDALNRLYSKQRAA